MFMLNSRKNCLIVCKKTANSLWMRFLFAARMAAHYRQFKINGLCGGRMAALNLLKVLLKMLLILCDATMKWKWLLRSVMCCAAQPIKPKH